MVAIHFNQEKEERFRSFLRVNDKEKENKEKNNKIHKLKPILFVLNFCK